MEMKKNYDSLKKDIDKAISRKKGLSVYNATNETVYTFVEILNEKQLSYQSIALSTFIEAEEPVNDGFRVAIVIQDLDESDLLTNIDKITNNVIYPLWFRGVSLVFISKLDRTAYLVNDIDSTLIHTDYKRIMDLLIMEQLNNLLDLTNTHISTPGLLELVSDDIRYTPIEKIFSEKLTERRIQYEPQVKIGRFYVDFIVQIKGSKVIVECDGRDYHDAKKDAERDKELKKEGYKIFRFSGSNIFNDCDKCIDEIIMNTQNRISKYALEDLNHEQMIAVNHVAGPMRVLAPAGSGKTKTLVNRIAQLINKGVAPTEIIALAFNKKAGEEMIARLGDRFGISNVEVKTFHSFGNDIIINKFKWKFDHENMAKTERKLMEEAVGRHAVLTRVRNKDTLEDYLSMLSKVKNELLPLSEMVIVQDEKSVDFEPIFKEFIKKSTQSNFYNYDDMLYFAARILLSDSQLRRKIQQTYRFVLVDEFQDLNKVQLLLLQILCLPENNLFIVGDDDQMIYGFRGAELRPILEFNNRYEITADQVLKINYRSCGNIVKHSKWLIDHNQVRVYKDIVPFSEEKGDVSLFIGANLTEQSDNLCKVFLEKKSDDNRWSDFAILIRHNQYKDLLKIALHKHGIPCYSEGGGLFQSKVGETIRAYLLAIFYPERCGEGTFKQILNNPNKYLTNEFISRIKKWEDFIDTEGNGNLLRKMDVDRYSHFVSKVVMMGQELKGMSVNQIVISIINEFELPNYFKDNSNITVDLESTNDFDQLEIFTSISNYFDSVDQLLSYWDDQELKQGEDGVIVSTVHKTKGNEFLNVAFFNVVKSITDKSTETELEEERRIAYVAVTRSKHALVVLSQKGHLSPFINEMFYNPKYNGKSEEELMNSLPLLKVKINVSNVKIQELEDQEMELISKLPELQGKSWVVKGLLKGIKTYIRKAKVDQAMRKLEQLQRNKQLLISSKRMLEDENSEIMDEITIRKLIKEGNNVGRDAEAVSKI